MSIKKSIIILGLSMLFAGCSTVGNIGYWGDASNADMGVRYLLGRGVPQDNVKAFYYFNRAANENDPFAQNELAYMYAAGIGTKRNNSQAFIWYQRAAQQGLASAEYNVGLMYLHGLGTPRNPKLAMKWIKKSAKHGFEPARITLKNKRA